MANEGLQDRIRRRLEFLYGHEAAPAVLSDVLSVVARHKPPPRRRRRWDENDALLITYADTLLEDGVPPLETLRRFLESRVGDLVTFVHVLPFYPYSSDDGFAVKDSRQVNVALGDWGHIERLAKRYRLVFDAVINHVSASSVYMERYAAGDPAFADFFIALPPDTDTSKVLRTRNLPLLHDYDTSAGRKWLWTTFGRDQVDLNFANPRVLLEILDVLLFYASKGAAAVRLDAVPYLWKKLGTPCAHLPETHEVIKLIRDVYDLACPDVLLITETNAPHDENVSYFGDRGDEAQIVYNFTLPPMILLAVATGDSRRLSQWASAVRKVSDRATYLNITATHDGIGMRPTEGILSEAERKTLIDLALAHGGQVTGRRNPDGSLSPYELNVNYFDAVNDPNVPEPLDVEVKRFMVSQAIPLSFIGIPAVYIHSLLGSRNDAAAVKETGIARRINRARMRPSDVENALADPASLRSRVFAEYTRLLAVRRRERAFHPDSPQEVIDLGPSVFALRRASAESGESIVALHNLSNNALDLDVHDALRGVSTVDLLDSSRKVESSGFFHLEAYQVTWLKQAL